MTGMSQRLCVWVASACIAWVAGTVGGACARLTTAQAIVTAAIYLAAMTYVSGWKWRKWSHVLVGDAAALLVAILTVTCWVYGGWGSGRLPWLSSLGVGLLGGAREVGVGVGGNFVAQGNSGAIAVSTELEGTGLMWILLLAEVASCRGQRTTVLPGKWMRCCLWGVVVVGMYWGCFAVESVGAESAGEVVVARAGSMGGAGIVGLLLAACGGWARMTAIRADHARGGGIAIGIGVACVFASALRIGIDGTGEGSLRWQEKGRRPQVLIDDRFSGLWAPAGRILDGRWWGDFSTYSFSALAERWSARADVAVNCSEKYTAEVLRAVDVLVLKTPDTDIPQQEVACIREWIGAGGCVIVFGDHTNLMGMNDRLNDVITGSGVALNPDAVGDAPSSGFSHVTLWPWEQCGMLFGVERLQLMTSASITCRDGARRVVVLPNQVREGHDYSAGSYFSAVRDSGSAVGPVCVCAVGRLGKGRVVAWGDSTVTSSFALPTWGRLRLFDNMLLLACNHAWECMALQHWMLLAAIGVGAIVARLRTSGGAAFCIAAVLAVTGDVARRCGPMEVWPGHCIVPVQGCQFMVPPTIGVNVEERALAVCYDTMLVGLMRYGCVPEVRDGEGGGDGLEMWIRPMQERVALLERRAREARGKVMIVCEECLMKNWRGVIERCAGWSIEEQGGEMIIGRAPDGVARIVIAGMAVDWSRVGLGHPFEYPTSVQRARYECLERMCRALGVGERRGAVRVM